MTDVHTCERCGDTFELSADVRERYPGWVPSLCRDCYGSEAGPGSGAGSRGSSSRRRGGARRSGPVEENLTVSQVLDRYDAGPDTGVFTDGSAHPNPGPGGWGAVYVIQDEVVAEAHGHDPETTNNRMELTALLEGTELVPEGTAATLFTDSRLCVDTITKWAAGWEQRGWKRKTGPVENLDLVRPLFERFQARPELSIAWVPAHQGYRWNEYADALSTAYRRDEV